MTSPFRILLLLTLVFSACTSKELIRPGDTLEEAYQKAYNLYQNERYNDAANAFETVIRIGRGTDMGRDAQYFLAESYFRAERWLVASAELERFITQFPRDTRREEIQFKEAYCYYMLSPRYRLDQSYTRQAIEKFRIFNSTWPGSEKVEEASAYIAELRGKLARKFYAAGDLYMRVDEYEAATIYFDLVIDNYPETAWAEQALVRQIDAWVVYAENSVSERQRERYQAAVESYETYLQLFPDGPNRQEAERHVDRARSGLAELDPAAGGTSATRNSRR